MDSVADTKVLYKCDHLLLLLELHRPITIEMVTYKQGFSKQLIWYDM